MLSWRATEFETAAANAGLVATALRSFHEWDASEPGRAVAGQSLMSIERIGSAPPRPLPQLDADQRPLEGVKVLDLTRILAGPVGARALAAYGADVMLVNAPHLPNIEAIADTSRGKRSVHLDLRAAPDRAAMDDLLEQAHVFIQGYRPGGLAALGNGPQEAAARRPGIVYVSLHGNGCGLASAAMRRRQLACAGFARSNRPLVAWTGSGAGWAARRETGHRALPGNGRVGFRQLAGLAPQCSTGANPGVLGTPVGTAGQRPAELGLSFRFHLQACAYEIAKLADKQRVPRPAQAVQWGIQDDPHCARIRA